MTIDEAKKERKREKYIKGNKEKQKERKAPIRKKWKRIRKTKTEKYIKSEIRRKKN